MMSAIPAVMRPPSAATAPHCTVELISDYRSFLQLEPTWNRLVEQAGMDHPFLTHEWVRTWWECFGEGKELHILVVKAGKATIAIAPLMLTDGRMYGLKVRCLASICNDHTPRFDFIITRSPSEVCRAIWFYLLNQTSLWDILQLRELPADSRTLAELAQVAAENGFPVGLRRSADSPYLPLLGSWDNYFKGLGAKHRSNLRNRLRRLSQLGQVKLEVVSSERLEGALEAGLRIEAAAWKGDAGTAILSRPELRLFYTRLAQKASEFGWLRLHFLTVGCRRIAFAYSLCYRNKLYLLKDGYDPEFARFSPFNLLCYMLLRDAFEYGLTEHDFMGAREEWKMKWARETRSHYSLFLFGSSMRTRLIHWAKFWLIPKLKGQRLLRAPTRFRPGILERI